MTQNYFSITSVTVVLPLCSTINLQVHSPWKIGTPLSDRNFLIASPVSARGGADAVMLDAATAGKPVFIIVLSGLSSLLCWSLMSV